MASSALEQEEFPAMILAALAIGAAIGAVAGFVTYGVKSLVKKEPFSWKAAASYAIGGLVGGASFPLIMAGMTAIGVPVIASYIVAGGLAWGGIWTLAQDLAMAQFGLTDGLGPWKDYLIATAVGLAVTAVLTPAAVRVIGPGLNLGVRPMTTKSFVTMSRPYVANTVKSEAEFLLFGAASESANAGVRAVSRGLAREGLTSEFSGATGAALRNGAVNGGRRTVTTIAGAAVTSESLGEGSDQPPPATSTNDITRHGWQPVASPQPPPTRSIGLTGALERSHQDNPAKD